MNAPRVFDLESSRKYWRHAPAGDSKRDTAAPTASDVWDAAFRSRLFTYPEEEQFLRAFAARARGCRIVSIGSGLGFHEVFYAASGASVVCCDIVASNLQTIGDVSAQKGLSITTVAADDVTAQPLPDQADVVFIYGCLMHMPPDAQRALLARARAALAPRGSVVLMVYAWEFPRRSCGWTDPSQFDPVAFARASDPTVGDEACPWSDWHDDAKLLALAGAGSRIIRRQAWNDGLFYWYELDWQSGGETPRPFFSTSTLDEGAPRVRCGHRAFTASDATLSRRWRYTIVRANASKANYVALSPELDGADANAVTVDLDVRSGACSVGILDTASQRFVATATRSTAGRRPLLLLADPLPGRFQIVLSNHQPAAAAPGLFRLQGARALRRTIAAPPPDRGGLL